MSNRSKALARWRLWSAELLAMARAGRVAPEEVRVFIADHLAKFGVAITSKSVLVEESDYDLAFGLWMDSIDRLYRRPDETNRIPF